MFSFFSTLLNGRDPFLKNCYVKCNSIWNCLRLDAYSVSSLDFRWMLSSLTLRFCSLVSWFLFIGCVLLCENFHFGCIHSPCQNTSRPLIFYVYIYLYFNFFFIHFFSMSLHRHFLCHITSFFFSIIPIS